MSKADRLDVYLVAGGKYHNIDYARLELLKLLAEQPERAGGVCVVGPDEPLEQAWPRICAALSLGPGEEFALAGFAPEETAEESLNGAPAVQLRPVRREQPARVARHRSHPDSWAA